MDDFSSDEILSVESQPSENVGPSFIFPLIEDALDADLIDSVDPNDVSLSGKTSKNTLTIKQSRNLSFSKQLEQKVKHDWNKQSKRFVQIRNYRNRDRTSLQSDRTVNQQLGHFGC